MTSCARSRVCVEHALAASTSSDARVICRVVDARRVARASASSAEGLRAAKLVGLLRLVRSGNTNRSR